jgi:peroxidase
MSELRTFSRGRLRSSRVRISGSTKEYLPFAKPGVCVDENDGLCFSSGDLRTSQNMALVGVHTVWLREHNRLAKALRRLKPTWSDEDLFQEARRINIAQYQHVLYTEWLPIIVGRRLMSELGLNTQPSSIGANNDNSTYFMGYDENANPSIAAEFSTAAFRFGHTLLRSFFSKIDRTLTQELANLTLSSIMLRPVEAYTNGGLDAIVRGLLFNSGTGFDSHITDQVLFR